MQVVRFTKFWGELDVAAMGERAATLGYDGLDLAVRPGHAIHPDNVASALPAAVASWAELGLACPMISADVNLIDPTAQSARTLFQVAGDCAVRGIKVGYFVHDVNQSGQSFDAAWGQAKRALRGFEALARRTGVQVLLHSHGGPCLGSTCAGLRHLLEDTDPAWLRAYPDLGHLAIGGEDVEVGFAMLHDRLSAVAAKDALHRPTQSAAPGPNVETAFVPLGHGAAQLGDAIRALHATDFRGPISVHTEYTSDARVIATVGGADNSEAAVALRERGEREDLALLRKLWSDASV